MNRSQKEKQVSNPGLYANIHAKRARGEKMRDKGDKGAPTDKDFANAAKTAKKSMGGRVGYKSGGSVMAGRGGKCKGTF